MDILNFAGLLILLLVPGLAARAAFPSLRRSESVLEAAFGTIFVSVLMSGWIALILVELGRLSLVGLDVIVAAVSFGLLIIRRRFLQLPYGLANLRITPWDLAVTLLLAAAAWLFFRPNEYVLGGRDHGVYVSTGATIARSGGLPLIDPALIDLTADQRAALTDYEPLERGERDIIRAWHLGASASGFYLFHLDSDIVIPHGFHFYPTWLAILNDAGGTTFSLFLTPALAWLSLIAIALTAQRAFGSTTGLLTGSLIAVNLAQIWYARTPSAEAMVQFLFWAGLWAWVRAVQTDASIYGLAGGLAWGQIHLTKIDYVTLPLTIGLWVAWTWWTGRCRRYHMLGLIAYGAMLAHAMLHGLFVSTSYTFDVLAMFAPVAWVEQWSRAAGKAANSTDFVLRLFSQNAGWILVGVVGLATIILGLHRIRGRGAAIWSRFASSRWGWLALAAVIVVLSVLAFFKPPPIDPAHGATVYTELGWYLGALAIALGTVEFVRRMGRCNVAQGIVLWSILGVSILLLAGGSFTYPDQFWAIRRFVPVIIPAILLLAASLVASLLPKRLDDWRQALLPAVLVIGMFAFEIEATEPFVRFVENEGLMDRLQRLDKEFEADAILVFDRDSPGIEIGTPLMTLFGRKVAFADAGSPAIDALRSVLVQWVDTGQPVYYLSSAPSPIDASNLSLDYLRTEVVARPSAEQTVVFRPVRTGELAYAYDVYRILPKQAVEDRVLTLDVGSEASEAQVQGLYSDSLVPNLTTARWTMPRASFVFTTAGRPRRLLFRMGGTPENVVSEVKVLANGERLHAFTLQPGRLDIYDVRFPEDADPVDAITVELHMQPWNPRTLGINADDRDLGVLLDWVKLVVKRP